MKIYIPHHRCCHCSHVARCHHLHVAISHTLPTSNSCHLHAAVGHTSPSLARITISCMVPTSDSCHPHVAVDHASPSLARHHWPHGAPKQCPSPTHHHCLRITIRVAVGCTVPPSDAHHPRVAVDRMSPSLARHHRPHGAPEQCPSPARHHCLRVTVCVAVGCTVPMSNACHPYVAVACTSPFASPSAAQCPRATPVTHMLLSPWMCRHCTQLEDAQSTILKYEVIFMVFEKGNKCRMFLYIPSAVLVS